MLWDATKQKFEELVNGSSWLFSFHLTIRSALVRDSSFSLEYICLEINRSSILQWTGSVSENQLLLFSDTWGSLVDTVSWSDLTDSIEWASRSHFDLNSTSFPWLLQIKKVTQSIYVPSTVRLCSFAFIDFIFAFLIYDQTTAYVLICVYAFPSA